MGQKNPQSLGINYLYFGLFFILLCLTCTSSVLLKDNLAGSRLFFWFYSLGQAALEVSLFAFLGLVIYRFFGRLSFWLFIGVTFVLFLLHVLDFMMDRILDLSTYNVLSVFVFGESLENFYYLLDASGVPLWAWVCIFIFLALLPLFGMLLYKGTAWFTKKKPVQIKNEVFLQLFVCIPVALFLWDYSASKVIHPDAYTEFVKSLPWKRTFLQPKTVQLPMQATLRGSKNEQEIGAFLEKVQPSPQKKPNIFLFVVESLRADFITPAVAPNLSSFREANIQAEQSLSSANATHMSWFSIFHSEFPFYWRQLQEKKWKMGSPALALFKKMGYQIRVYSAAELHYYGMTDLLFGENQTLADSLQIFNHSPPKEAYEADTAALDSMLKDLQDPAMQEGQLIVIFWDGTHFDYSWPKQSGAAFNPFATEFAYFKAFHSRANIELIRNRYRNAVHYMDSLFGKFLQAAPSDAIIAFTGDHGEEFFDHGHLFHGSHLIEAQTSVPIYLKIGGRKEKLPMISHIDIMPSLLNAGLGISAPFLEGASVGGAKKWPFAMSARFNGGCTPCEFFLHNGTNKLMLQFENKKNIFDCTDLKILSLRTANDASLRGNNPASKDWIFTEFSSAFERLFSKKE